MEFTLKEAKALVGVFNPNNTEETISVFTGDDKDHSGRGLYAYHIEYPEEGAIYLSD